MSEPKIVTLDVRPALAAGEEPFGSIMKTAGTLTGSGDRLILIAPFEPVPLIPLLRFKGFRHEKVARDDGAYEIWFTHK